MRPRTSLLLLVSAIGALGFLAATLGSRAGRPQDADARRSTFLTSPAGARAWADALQRLGVRVIRFRRRTADLPPASPGAVVAILDPVRPLSANDARLLVGRARRGGAVLAAGRRSDALFECYHLAVVPRFSAHAMILGDSVPVDGVFDTATTPRPVAGRGAVQLPACAPGAYRSDTLVRANAAPVVIRVMPDSGAPLTLVAAGNLFANRTVRDTRAGEYTLGLVAGSFDQVIVDEYHQGFGPGGSITGAARTWLLERPAGWLLLQWMVVGVLVLIAAGIRFGPARHVIVRRRRSSLEHVQALATALASARGHRVAVSLLVRGLRRRLAGAAGTGPRSTDAWLAGLAERTRTPAGRQAAGQLIHLTREDVRDPSVREAAMAVEDVWQDLSP